MTIIGGDMEFKIGEVVEVVRNDGEFGKEIGTARGVVVRRATMEEYIEFHKNERGLVHSDKTLNSERCKNGKYYEVLVD